jgi:hypothetical protein
LANLGLAASVSSKALTVALKGEDGNDPAAANPVTIKFRDETLTTGTPNTRTVTGALSVVLPSGGTLGFAAGGAGRIYVWAIDNGGTVEMALSRTADIFPESNLVSTTAIGSGSDSASVMYSTTARTNVACRCIGYVEITTGATAGEWDNAPTKIQIMGPGVRRTGDIVQICTTQLTTPGNGTVTIPLDSTIPQKTEGNAIMDVAIIPTSAINILVVECFLQFMGANTSEYIISALFKNDDSDAVKVGFSYSVNYGSGPNIMEHREPAGSTSAITFKVRAGTNSAAGIYWNRIVPHTLGNVVGSNLKVTEVFA